MGIAVLIVGCTLSGCGIGVDPLAASDSDRDAVSDQTDRCPGTSAREPVDASGCSAAQRDSDGDGYSDADEMENIPGTDPLDPTDHPFHIHDRDGDGCSDFDESNFVGFCDNDPNTPKPDADADGVPDESDNCISDANRNQYDSDGDGFGDACDICRGGNDRFDLDGDGVPDYCDVCPLTFDPAQLDSDSDGTGNACEIFLDSDDDGVENSADNCVTIPNHDQIDSDLDGTGDACDSDSAPPFVSGNVFTFLSPDETDLFLSLIAMLNADIDSTVNADLSWTLADLQDRGLSNSSLRCNAECDAEQTRIAAKRDGTASSTIAAAASFGIALRLGLAERAEIDAFNCRKYPNRSITCTSAPGIPPILCEVGGPPCD